MDEQRVKKWLGKSPGGTGSPLKKPIRLLGSSSLLVQFSAVKYPDSSLGLRPTLMFRGRANSLPAKVSNLQRRPSGSARIGPMDRANSPYQPISTPEPAENYEKYQNYLNYNPNSPPYHELFIPPLPTAAGMPVEPMSTARTHRLSPVRQEDNVDQLATSILHVISDTEIEWVM
ncbi:uncharacterized protein CANTADRAFT_23438 [Suhomyces tanzawaensis NRRL Y-17324]|uniref:Uncharacterized protein n=1 Tax=Suhomyces tanzawaensis NRRL Y-17324 TaxID=984487 RepID=A0A1E4SCW5_9ASCO|nr:uncharacterized protein CANTADRAFT_23438 [Suhomyces tanzawaensis NRRL Y-17324]ODV77308.1 hypothetical protein CANTADRAFT_23438 [Suhomyces tanzawaensis NRRL Y-17324]